MSWNAWTSLGGEIVDVPAQCREDETSSTSSRREKKARCGTSATSSAGAPRCACDSARRIGLARGVAMTSSVHVVGEVLVRQQDSNLHWESHQYGSRPKLSSLFASFRSKVAT